jgi:hypothetical protein
MATLRPMPPLKSSTVGKDALFISLQEKEKALEGVNLFLHPNGEYHDWEIESWPENLASEAVERHVIPPTRGGFVWPGSSEFPFNVKSLFPTLNLFSVSRIRFSSRCSLVSTKELC